MGPTGAGRGRRARRRVALATTALVASGLLAACDGGGSWGRRERRATTPRGARGRRPSRRPAWPGRSTPPCTCPTGSTVDTGEPIRAFLVAGDGVFFVPAADGRVAGRLVRRRTAVVRHARRRARGHGPRGDRAGGVVASPDGRLPRSARRRHRRGQRGDAHLRPLHRRGPRLRGRDGHLGHRRPGRPPPRDGRSRSSPSTTSELTARVIEGEVTYDLAHRQRDGGRRRRTDATRWSRRTAQVAHRREHAAARGAGAPRAGGGRPRHRQRALDAVLLARRRHRGRRRRRRTRPRAAGRTPTTPPG